MKQILKLVSIVLIFIGFSSFVEANMPPAQMKQILNMTKTSWVSYRDFDGKQFIYFTHLESYTCGIKEVKYSINSNKLDQVWVLQSCDKNNPMAMIKEIPYLSLKLDTAQFISLQLKFIDDTLSEVVKIKK